MTTHYIDLEVIPDPESGPVHLMGALYDHLHLALVRLQTDRIGISFPGYGTKPRTLGTTLRIFGNPEMLESLLAAEWLGGMRDHVAITAITQVPANAAHRAVARKQFKTNAERLRRRRMQRKGETAEQAKAAIPDSVERRPTLPYLHLHSRSTRQPFSLFIALGPLQPEATPGKFSRYGLGGPTTTPWF